MSVISAPKTKIVNATDTFTFVLTPRHVELATCRDKSKCVVAQAFKHLLGSVLDNVQVGPTVTILTFHAPSDELPRIAMRYNTPAILSRAVLHYDRTLNSSGKGEWDLPPGQYTLLPYQKRPRRWEQAKRNGGVQSVFKARSLPLREVVRANAA